MHGLVNNAGGQFRRRCATSRRRAGKPWCAPTSPAAFWWRAKSYLHCMRQARRRHRQHERRHVGRHARHGPLRRGARRHGQLHQDRRLRVGPLRRARQRRGAGLDRLQRHGHLSGIEVQGGDRRRSRRRPAAAHRHRVGSGQRAIVFLLSDAASFITGTNVRIDGGVAGQRAAWPLGNKRVNGLERLPTAKSFPTYSRPTAISRTWNQESAMAVIESKSTASPAFAANREMMLKAIADFRAIEQRWWTRQTRPSAEIRQARPAAAARAHQPAARCRLAVPRARSPRRPHGQCTTTRTAPKPAAALIAGIGYVSGVRCLVRRLQFGIKGGTISRCTGLQKSLRLQTIAQENKLPMVHARRIRRRQPQLPPSTFLSKAARLFCRPGAPFRNGHAADDRGAWQRPPPAAPTAGPVRLRRDGARPRQAHMFLAGPPLLKAATGEDRHRGGTRRRRDARVGCRHSPNTSPRTTPTASAWPARLMASFPGTIMRRRVRKVSREPLYPADELLGMVPARHKEALRRARDHRPHRRRLRLPRLQARATTTRRSAATLEIEGPPAA
jgi:hypothetical protein